MAGIKRSQEWLIKRILSRINKLDERSDCCWIWKGAKSHGYGNIRHNYETFKVHRIIYAHFNGKIPDNLCVLHKCDNRACCNPEHLFLGDTMDNMLDMTNKGRSGKKLTPKEVMLIFGYAGTYASIARAFNISSGMVGHIKHGRAWGHLCFKEMEK